MRKTAIKALSALMTVLIGFTALVSLGFTPPVFADGGFTFSYDEQSGKCSVTGYSDVAVDKLVIPSELGGHTVTGIGGSAFAGYASLVSVTIPASVEIIASAAFNCCKTLERVTFEGDSRLTRIDEGAFKDCVKYGQIDIPDTVVNVGADAFCRTLDYSKQPDGIAYIDGVAIMKGDVSYTSVTLDAGTRVIADGCFNKQAELVSADGLSDIKGIGANAFQNCEKLRSLAFGGGISYIGYGAFANCYSLETIDFGENCTFTNIPGSMLISARALESVRIPASVITIEIEAFADCLKLSSVTFDKGSKLEKIMARSFFSCAFSSIELPTCIKSIADMAFVACNNLENVVIPTSTITISETAFFGCQKLVFIAYNNTIKNRYASVIRFGYGLIGDMDGDSDHTVADALSVLRFAAKISVPTAAENMIADYDRDGDISVVDALSVLRIAAKITVA